MRVVTIPPETLAFYRRMAGLTGADLAEHMRDFPDFAEWFACQEQKRKPEEIKSVLKSEKIIDLARSGLADDEIAARLNTSVNCVRVICSRARKSGLDVPYEIERSVHNEVIVTLSASQIDKIKNMTDLSPQEFVNLSVDQIVSTSFLKGSDRPPSDASNSTQ